MSGSTVAMVGGGPGDPELLTLRAEARLESASLVIADASLVDMAGPLAGDAQVLGVLDGRSAISMLLRMSARPGRPVVRLYRGDPWLHPAFEVEREALERAHRTVEVVAGVAVEIACPALAGVPVHLRQLAVACTIGPYEALPPAIHPARTLVGAGAEPAAMVRALADRGDGTIPAALVPVDDPAATWRGSLADAAGPAAAVAGAALLVVGSVCGPVPGPLDGGVAATPTGSADPGSRPDHADEPGGRW